MHRPRYIVLVPARKCRNLPVAWLEPNWKATGTIEEIVSQACRDTRCSPESCDLTPRGLAEILGVHSRHLFVQACLERQPA